jgi:hypothetical protein
MLIRRLDPFTGKRNELDLDVTEEQMQRWRDGEYAQRAFPNLNADEREFIMTGIMPDTWDELFLIDEDFDDDDSISF